MTETDAINRVHNKERKSNVIDRKLVRVWKVRDDFTAGVLDCQYTNRVGFKTTPLYIEWKHKKELPIRDTTIIFPKWHGLEQQNWANELYTSGNKVLIIVTFGAGTSAGAVVFIDQEWNTGLPTSEAKRRAIKLNSCAPLIQEILTNDGKIPDIFKNFEGNLN